MADAPARTVQCSLMLPFWDMVFVCAPGLHAVFTLGEVLIVLGNHAVIDLCQHHRATVEITRPIAWPLNLKRPPADVVQPFPPVVRAFPLPVSESLPECPAPSKS